MKMDWDSEYIEYLIKSGDFDKDSFYRDNALKILLDCMKASEIACIDVDSTVQNGVVAMEEDIEFDSTIQYLKEDIADLNGEIYNLEEVIQNKEEIIEEKDIQIKELKEDIRKSLNALNIISKTCSNYIEIVETILEGGDN